MSAKRQATTDLNHDNWDQDDPVEPEDETGGFAIASKEVLEKRVIKTAKRQLGSRIPNSGEAKKSVFSGFSGFNKTQQQSFDFLSNLTNGSNKNNGTPTSISETAVSSSSISSKPSATTSSGIFSLSGTSTPTKSAFGKPASDSPLLASVSASPIFAQSVFTTSKADSTVNDNPFKMQSTVASPIMGDFGKKSNATTEKPLSQVSSTIFGTPSTSVNSGSSLFSTTSNNFAAFKKQTTPIFNQSNEVKKPESKSKDNENQLIYYNKLKGLNESVSDWIKKHVEETPLCILTPIFKDYEKHLKEIQAEYEKSKELSKNESKEQSNTNINENITETKHNTSAEKSLPTSPINNVASTLFSGTKTPSFFAPIGNQSKASITSFGINTSTSVSVSTFSTTTTPSTGFSFGIKPSSITPPSTIAMTSANGSSPFSFGIGKPFSFNTNINTSKTEESTNEGNENDDEPPKVEYTPIVEENSVYDKKCKIFVKKDSNYMDKGVGTLYIKKIEDTGKHQLLARANTTMGNVLLNMVLGTSIPTQRMGKNNVMMVCIPTPDAKPPPTSILIRVKTSEEADELLGTLNKYKA